MSWTEWYDLFTSWGYTREDIISLGNALGEKDAYHNEHWPCIVLQSEVNNMCFQDLQPAHTWQYHLAPKMWEIV